MRIGKSSQDNNQVLPNVIKEAEKTSVVKPKTVGGTEFECPYGEQCKYCEMMDCVKEQSLVKKR